MKAISMKCHLKTILPFVLILLCGFFSTTLLHAEESVKSVRKERKLIRQGNLLYEDGKFREAAKKYSEALSENPASGVGLYNLGMAQIRQGNVADTTSHTEKILQEGIENLKKAASLGIKNPDVAGRASYNLGNLSFNKQDYQGAIECYKEALRINPSDNNARRNLRIAQKKLQDQNQDKNKDKNQDKNKNQDQDKDKDKNKDQNHDQNQNKDKQEPPKQNKQDISQQTADQILQAVENKENQTRSRLMRGQGQGKGQESSGKQTGRRNW